MSNAQPTPIAPLSLYALTEELRLLEEDLLESGGVIDSEMEERYGELLDAEQTKVESYLKLLRKFEASAEAIRLERERLQAAERTMASAAKSLKDRLRESMLRRGTTGYDTPIGKVRLQQASSVPVELKVAPEALPAHFKRTRVEPDLRALQHALKEGDASAQEYAQLGEPSYFIRIY